MTEGLLTQKPGREPEVGQVKCFTVEHKPAVGGKKAWIKVKNSTPDKGGTSYKILSVTPNDYTDSYGNISFNIELEPAVNGDAYSPTGTGAQPSRQRPSEGTDNARHYMMRAANLLQMAHNAASCVLGKDYTGEDARTLFIQAAREGYVAQMPDKPVSSPEQAKTMFNATESENVENVNDERPEPEEPEIPF